MSADRPLRLLVVSPTSVAGGAEKILLDQLRRLESHGIQATTVVLAPGWLHDTLRDEGHQVELVDAGRMRTPLAGVRAVRRLTALARAHDLVYCSQPKAHLYAGPAARIARRPAVWAQVVVPDPPHPIDRIVSRLPAASVVVLSEMARVAQDAISGSPRAELLQPGVDLERFTPDGSRSVRAEFGIADDELLVGIIGRLQRWKRQDVFLEAAARLVSSRPNVRFAVVGGALLGWEGDYPDELRRKAEALGIADRVVFTGHRDDVAAWTRSLDIAVNTSDPEPFGLVIIEALASGTPVVAVNTGGPAEVVRSGIDGLLVPRCEAGEFAGAIGSLLDSDELRARMSVDARRRAADFSLDQTVERFATHLWSVADRSRTSKVSA